MAMMDELHGKTYGRAVWTLLLGILSALFVAGFWTTVFFVETDAGDLVYMAAGSLVFGIPGAILFLDYFLSRTSFSDRSVQIKILFKTTDIPLEDIASVRRGRDGLELCDQSGRRLGVIFYNSRNYKRIKLCFLADYDLSESTS
ncbi:MAG: hypothetical protein LAT64_07790 [Phycisphaerales bacterium]|nr:hypothetical protein [Planctomycetota bacterium]MCH8508657.1 hypothetical protein [Phycisphaerales bacterium]